MVRAELRVYDLLRNEERIKTLFGAHIYAGYVAPNTISSVSKYILIHRLGSTILDRSLADKGDKCRLVRLQVDVRTKVYAEAVNASEIIREVMEEEFPSCTDGDNFGTDTIGQTTWLVQSVDYILQEGE